MAFSPCLVRAEGDGCGLIRIGHPLLDAYLELVAARARPNTVLAHAYDLKVFFTVIDREPVAVVPADVLAFITEQRKPRRASNVVRIEDGEVGLSDNRASSCHDRRALRLLDRARRRDGEPGAAWAGDTTRWTASCSRCAVDSGAAHAAADHRPGWHRRVHTGAAHATGPGDDRCDVARRSASLRGAGSAVQRYQRWRASRVHRRGQGRSGTDRADLIAVLHGVGRLSRRRTPRQRGHGPAVRGVERPTSWSAVECCRT